VTMQATDEGSALLPGPECDSFNKQLARHGAYDLFSMSQDMDLARMPEIFAAAKVRQAQCPCMDAPALPNFQSEATGKQIEILRSYFGCGGFAGSESGNIRQLKIEELRAAIEREPRYRNGAKQKYASALKIGNYVVTHVIKSGIRLRLLKNSRGAQHATPAAE